MTPSRILVAFTIAQWLLVMAASCAVGNAGPGCTACPIGSYSLAGATHCTSCPSGETCPIASVSIAACHAIVASSPAPPATTTGAGCAVGNAGPGCTACPIGSYSLAGATHCTQCPSGETCPIASVSIAACHAIVSSLNIGSRISRLAVGCAVGNAGPGCTACPIGSYSLAGATHCTSCPSGETCPIASVSIAACHAIVGAGCPVGNAGPGCTPCPIGSWSLAGAKQCTSCAPGFSSPIASVGPAACYPLPASAAAADLFLSDLADLSCKMGGVPSVLCQHTLAHAQERALSVTTDSSLSATSNVQLPLWAAVTAAVVIVCLIALSLGLAVRGQATKPVKSAGQSGVAATTGSQLPALFMSPKHPRLAESSMTVSATPRHQ
jgi:hypothetical protein